MNWKEWEDIQVNYDSPITSRNLKHKISTTLPSADVSDPMAEINENEPILRSEITRSFIKEITEQPLLFKQYALSLAHYMVMMIKNHFPQQ
ncbi:MAG: hypothetical protein LBF70_00245 [Holosporales bacterium]|nr:hypothetical protein [Holosporales bacterium]